MDDKIQTPSQNQTNVQAQPQAQALQGQPQTPVQQPPAQQPQDGAVGSLVKEHGPVATGEIMPSRPEPEIHRELKEIVKSVPEFPTVGPLERKVGIEPAGDSVPVEPSGIVHPSIMTEEEARQTAKHEKPENALKWFAALVVKHFKAIHHKLLTSKV